MHKFVIFIMYYDLNFYVTNYEVILIIVILIFIFDEDTQFKLVITTI